MVNMGKGKVNQCIKAKVWEMEGGGLYEDGERR